MATSKSKIDAVYKMMGPVTEALPASCLQTRGKDVTCYFSHDAGYGFRKHTLPKELKSGQRPPSEIFLKPDPRLEPARSR